MRFDRFELDEANARLLREGEPVPIAPTPFGVLCALARQPGSLLTTDALLDEVWGHQFVTDSVLRTAISELRTALDDDARKPRFIETVSRRGYRFIATTHAIADAPRPAGSADARAVHLLPFVGRALALSRLRANWDLACGGQRKIVFVAGEPGIGKTTLIEHFIGGLGDVLCARGQCVDQYGSGEPYLPVLEATSELCRNDASLVSLFRAVAPTWLLQLPWLSTPEERDALRRELAGAGTERMLREMGAVLDRCGERRPLLLVTEDLHWSDRATIQLMDYVARRRGTAPLMWLSSFRVAEIVALDHPLNRLRRELRLHGLCEEVALDPFSESEVAEYLAQRVPAIAGDETFVRALHDRTDGLPLFVAAVTTEVMAGASRTGNQRAAARQLESMAVPENLAAIIDHYIAQLSSDERMVLTAAAVYGVEFAVDAIAKALERDAAWVEQLCEALAHGQLWLTAAVAEPQGAAAERSYSFRHALFRQVLYDRTAVSTRAALHRKIAALLEQHHGGRVPAGELASHFERAGDAMAAMRYYARAAEGAMARFSTEECLRITEHASTLLRHAPQGAERDAIETALQTLRGLAATRVLGAGDEAKAAFERAYALLEHASQHPMRGRLLHALGFLLTWRAEYAGALAVADRAETLGSATDDPVLLSTAWTVRGQVDQRQGRTRAARTWLERGLVLAERVDVGPGEFLVDPQVLLLGMLAVPLVHLGLVEDARAYVQRAQARARDRRWPMATLSAIWYGCLIEVRLGNAERVAALADDMRALVEEFALAHGRTACRWFRGWAAARLGAPAEGYHGIREAYEENVRLGMLSGSSETLGYATEALLLAGDVAGAERELEEALRIADSLGERVYLPELFLLQAAIARARAQQHAAGAACRRALAEARTQEAPWLELLALTELWEVDGATAQDRRALASLVDGLSQAGGTAAVARARALIDKAKST